MASVLIYIQAERLEPTTASLEAVGEGRRIATTLGASLYALVTVTKERTECTPLIAKLSQGGVDRVIVVHGEANDGPALWTSRKAAFKMAVEKAKPNLVLLSDDDAGRDIGPRLAAILGGTFLAEPAVHYGSHGEVVFSRTMYGATYRERINCEDVEVPIVATLTPGSYTPAKGTEEAEAWFVEASEAKSPFELVDQRPDQRAGLDSARTVVCAGGGITKETLPLIAKLAKTLGAELAATRSACARGVTPIEWMVDVCARTVAPDLYIACGVSGSGSHLGAVSPDAEIVAINSDEAAPIFRVASYGVVGDIANIVPDMISALEARGKS